MAGAIHRILLGNQEAAATWLPFAMGQFYACPEGAQTSFTPVPGVTILVKRVGGQDVVQITAGGSPDWVLLDDAVPTTAIGPPLVFTPNNPERKPEGPTNAYSHRLTNIGDGMLFSSHGVGLQNDTTQPYIERLTVWKWVGPWYAVIGGEDIESPPAQSSFTTRPPSEVTDTLVEIAPGEPRVHRLIAIVGPLLSDQAYAGLSISDDLGNTWVHYLLLVPNATNDGWYSEGVYRIDSDTLIFTYYAVDTGLGLRFIRGTEGGLNWLEQNDLYGAPIGLPPTLSIDLLNAKFYPCKTPGVALGVIAMMVDYVPEDPNPSERGFALRTTRTTDSGATFTYQDHVIPAIGPDEEPYFSTALRIYCRGIWFDPTTKTYASLITRDFPLDYSYGARYPMMMVTSNDEGMTWQLHPVYNLYSYDDTVYTISGQGFYNGRFYITFFEQFSGKTSFSYSTKDYGVTWVKHAHSEDAGRGLSPVVQLFPNGKAFPHRLDM